MGLSVAMGNALAGMSTGQRSLEILSRNVSNAGTPGYHRQNLSLVETYGSSSSVYGGNIQRAFSSSLQTFYTREVSDGGFANVRASLLDRLQSAFGKPGDAGSLDTTFQSLSNALSALSTSPDNFATRADAVAKAQDMVATLNRLSAEVQGLRQEAETQIGSHVAGLNRNLQLLSELNQKLGNSSIDETTRAGLLDQRDRLVAEIAEVVDVRVDYRENGTVSLMTRAGVGLLDNRASVFEFSPAGKMSANSLFNADPAANDVGMLTLTTPAGLRLDLVAQNVLQSGQLAGLIELRDKSLVAAQSQLDEIAAGLALAFSTKETQGSTATVGLQNGLDLDLASIRPGNDFALSYTQNGIEKNIKVVCVEDAGNLPMDFVDADGTRVIGMSFAGGAAGVAAQLNGTLTGLTISGAGSVLRVLDDGAVGTTDVGALTSRTTATQLRDGGPALALFVDAGGDFTNSLDGVGQKRGFASRIAINGAVLADNRLLVQHETGASLGDATRADFLSERLGSARFNSTTMANWKAGDFKLSGTISEMIGQTINFQGETVATALGTKESRALSLETLTARLDDEYGVNVDDEMARLMELQNAFAANARVIAAVQELINALMNI